MCSTQSAIASPQVTTTNRPIENVNDYCGLLGFAAGVFAGDPSLRRDDVEDSTTYISDRTAFDFSETKSRMSDIAKNASLLTLTPAEFAGHTYFWCVYDLIGAEPGTDDIFEIETTSIEQYRIMFKPEDQ